VEAGERLRLFCALRLPDDVVEGVVRWQREHVTAGRVVPRENLHLTLAFLGSTPRAATADIVGALREAAAAAGPVAFELSGYREGRSVGMLVFDDEGGHGGALARDLHGRLAGLGVYEPEQRPWLPHLTVVRFREKPRLRPNLPAVGRVVPSDAALYNSLLRSTGAQYVVIEPIALGGS
jgi:RNA 2',3'-cyclic 3'-phosphodiesterase